MITHDVDLLDALSRGTQIEHYHKVSRDENGESIVNKTAVSTRWRRKILSNWPGCLYFLQNSELTKFLFRDENGKSIVNKNVVKADEENLVKSTWVPLLSAKFWIYFCDNTKQLLNTCTHTFLSKKNYIYFSSRI